LELRPGTRSIARKKESTENRPSTKTDTCRRRLEGRQQTRRGRIGRPYTPQNISEGGIEEAGVRAGLGNGVRAHTLRHSFCTFIAESSIPPNEGAALTGHDLQTWWKSSVRPRLDKQSRADSVEN
jgi:integrase